MVISHPHSSVSNNHGPLGLRIIWAHTVPMTLGGPVLLIVDDEDSILKSLSSSFGREGYRSLTALGGSQALKHLEENSVDLVLLDVWLPGIDGLEVLRLIKEQRPKLPVIVMTGHGSIEMAVRATKLGASDFVEKPFSLDKMLLMVERALKISSLEVENRELKRIQFKEEPLLGSHEATEELRQNIQIIAPSLSRVLIRGEIGTGKELVAKLIHQHSKRSQEPFISLNCAMAAPDVFESELFGTEGGDGPQGSNPRRGAIERAEGGTLFLDNVADLSLAAQSRLLQFLQEGSFSRIGGQSQLKADVRLLCSTHRDLEALVKAGGFREDLYFRLNVVPLLVPPLEKRKEDIPELSAYFLDKICKENGKLPRTLHPEAINRLQHYRWPGNVRELRNILERLALLSPEPEIGPEEVALLLADEEMDQSTPTPGSFKEAIKTFEKQFLADALVRNNNNITHTAEKLHMERAQLSRKLKVMGLSPTDH